MFKAIIFLAFLLFLGKSMIYVHAFPDCEEIDVGDQWTRAFEGWPYLISCGTLLGEVEDWFYEDENRFNVTLECIINNQMGLVFNVSGDFDAFNEPIDTFYVTPDLYENVPTNYTLTIKSDQMCWFTNLHLKLLDMKPTSCNAFLEDRLHHLFVTRGSGLLCGLYDNIFPKVADPQQVMSYQWYYNCHPKDGAKSPYLTNPVDSGSYSCSVTHNGMTRFLYAVNLTVEDGDGPDYPLILKCESTMIKENGDRNADVKCKLQGGRAIKESNVVISLRNESGSFSCEEKILVCKEKKAMLNSCGVSCYYINKQTNSSQGPIEEAEIRINFANITKQNYGTYILTADNTREIVHETLELRPNLEAKLLSSIEIVGVSIGVLIFLLLLMGIIFYNVIYIRVFYKRYFGIYEIDNKEYGAMLAYSYSKDHDIFSQEILQTSVRKTRKFLQSRGYEIFEEGKDGWFAQGGTFMHLKAETFLSNWKTEDRADCINESVGKSHRIIIFVSKEFIRDGWSMLTLFKGFEEMINSGSKLIFILLPGIKEYLEQHSQDDDTCRLMLRAIKVNHSIKVSRRNRDNRFNFQLEDAMPRLEPSSDSSVKHSVSSDSDVVFPLHHTRNCERRWSNDTKKLSIETVESDFQSDSFEIGLV